MYHQLYLKIALQKVKVFIKNVELIPKLDNCDWEQLYYGFKIWLDSNINYTPSIIKDAAMAKFYHLINTDEKFLDDIMLHKVWKLEKKTIVVVIFLKLQFSLLLIKI